MRRFTAVWPLALLAIVITAATTLALRPYDGNVSALFHLDRTLSDQHPVPSGFVILGMPGYDGAEYWQVARNLPTLVTGQWDTVTAASPGAYAYQRILLPVIAFSLALGQDRALPFAFFAVNALALFLTCWLLIRWKPTRPWHALALAWSPAAAIAMHFMLAEPLTILLTTAFLLRYKKRGRIDAWQIVFLSLLVLSREVNILFVGGVLAYSLVKKRWHDAAVLTAPIGTFLALHGLIYAVFREIPFLWSADKRALPLTAIAELLAGKKGYTVYTLSSIALFLGFVVPALLVTIWDTVRTKKLHLVNALLLLMLAIMVSMPDHIWGSITSIGRVITPVYPLWTVYALEQDRWPHRLITIAMLLLGIGVSLGLGLIVHPFTLAP